MKIHGRQITLTYFCPSMLSASRKLWGKGNWFPFTGSSRPWEGFYFPISLLYSMLTALLKLLWAYLHSATSHYISKPSWMIMQYLQIKNIILRCIFTAIRDVICLAVMCIYLHGIKSGKREQWSTIIVNECSMPEVVVIW